MPDTPSVRGRLLPYRTVADLIVRVWGEGCEAVLHDLEDPCHSVVYVAGSNVTGRAAGQGFRHLVSEMLRAQAEGSDLTPNWWFEQDGRLVRSTSLFIRDAGGGLAGALCVNIDVTEARRELARVQALLPGKVDRLPAGGADIPDTGIQAPCSSVVDSIYGLIDRIVPAEVRDREERLSLVSFMEERGIFLVKGALEHASKRLGVARVTIYSDLELLKRRREKTVPKNMEDGNENSDT